MTIQNLMRDISLRAERLNWGIMLPAREGIMLMQGVDEPRGSDYDKETLNTPTGELKEKHDIETESNKVVDEIENQEQKFGEQRQEVESND